MRFDQSALGGRFRPILDIFRLVCSCFLAPFVGPLDELSFSDTLKLRHPDDLWTCSFGSIRVLDVRLVRSSLDVRRWN